MVRRVLEGQCITDEQWWGCGSTFGERAMVLTGWHVLVLVREILKDMLSMWESFSNQDF